MTATTRRRARPLMLALLTGLALLAAVPAAPARPVAAAPDEGGSKTLREALEDAAKGYIDAKAKLDHSKKRKQELTSQLRKVEVQLGTLTKEVAAVAERSYRTGRMSSLTVLLNSSSPDAFLERMAGLDLIAQRDNARLRTLVEKRELVTRAKVAIDHEIVVQRKQLKIMDKKKRDAERALASVGGYPVGGYVSGNSPLAEPAPRNADGSWPAESCTIDDPTTSGCITPRTLHAMKQAKSAGFTRYVSCYRSGGSGEHPKGRACDFSASAGGFRNASATGGDREYGNELAAYFIKNADRLAVLYVIWYRQIWMPGTGWRAYSGGGSPAADHTNHVHLSVY